MLSNLLLLKYFSSYRLAYYLDLVLISGLKEGVF